MITLKVDKTEYNVPISWAELTMAQWLTMLKTELNWRNVIGILTGMNEQTLNSVTERSLANVIPLIKWIENKVDLSLIEPTETFEHQGTRYTLPKQIGEQTFGQKILLHQALTGDEMNVNKTCYCVAIYLLPQITKQTFDPDKIEMVEQLATELEKDNMFEIIGAFNRITKQFSEIVDRENKQLTKPPKIEHVRAGVQMFEKFEHFNTIDALANGNVLKYKAVQQMEYNTIFMKLLLLHTTSIYQDNLNNVMKK